MDNKRNYYRLLHVQFDAPAVVIKSSYRTMMQKLKLHPDLGGDEPLAKVLNEAVQTLLDADKREQYDCWLAQNYQNTYQRSSSNKASAYPNEQKVSLEQTSTCCAFCQKLFVEESQESLRLWDEASICVYCSAPLTAVSPCVGQQLDELRCLHRTHLPMGVSVVLSPNGQAQTMQLIDFSTQGLALGSEVKLESRQRILVQSQYLSAIAEVVYCERERLGFWRVGVQFHTLVLDMPKGGLISAEN